MSTRKERLEKFFELFDDLDETDILASTLLSKISLKIAKYRLDHKMTQKEFANFLGMSQSMVSKIESEDYNYSMKMLVKIFYKMKVSFDIVFSDENTYKEVSFEEINNRIDAYNYNYHTGDIASLKAFQTNNSHNWYIGADGYDQYTA